MRACAEASQGSLKTWIKRLNEEGTHSGRGFGEGESSKTTKPAQGEPRSRCKTGENRTSNIPDSSWDCQLFRGLPPSGKRFPMSLAVVVVVAGVATAPAFLGYLLASVLKKKRVSQVFGCVALSCVLVSAMVAVVGSFQGV